MDRPDLKVGDKVKVWGVSRGGCGPFEITVTREPFEREEIGWFIEGVFDGADEPTEFLLRPALVDCGDNFSTMFEDDVSREDRIEMLTRPYWDSEF